MPRHRLLHIEVKLLIVPRSGRLQSGNDFLTDLDAEYKLINISRKLSQSSLMRSLDYNKVTQSAETAFEISDSVLS